MKVIEIIKNANTKTPNAKRNSRLFWTPKLLEICKIIDNLGIEILATTGTLQFLSKNNIKAKGVKKAYEGRPNIIDLLTDNKINLVINTTAGLQSIEDSKGIRILALEKNLPYYMFHIIYFIEWKKI